MLRFSRFHALSVVLPHIFLSASARVMWIPGDFVRDAARLLPRTSNGNCSADSSLMQCPGDFPPNFCCAPGLQCLAIDTGNSSVTSTICCKKGSDCSTISPVACNETLQDANEFPGSQLHSIPPLKFSTCGIGCCPAGYTCQGGQCRAERPLSASTNFGSSSSTTTAAAGAPTVAPASTHPLDGTSPGTAFSGASFAAGFIPGIAIGLIVAALAIFLCISRGRKKPETYGEKSRDTLTDLSTLHPTSHGRSISEPTIDATAVTRTEFLRGTPPRTAHANGIVSNTTYQVDASGPRPDASRTPRIKALFSHSPFLDQTPSTPPSTQPPIPAHLKRGTLNFTISPIRGLKKQKSMHSLRRQMRDSARHGPALNRTESTETIQVLMPNNEPYTPDQRTIPEDGPTLQSAKYQAPRSAGTWNTSKTPDPRTAQPRTPYASSSRYPSELPQLSIPAPPPPLPTATNGGTNFLDSPYTPTRSQGRGVTGGLAVPGDPADIRRETTFSTLMEKAGLRKSDLVMGTKKKVDGRYGW